MKVLNILVRRCVLITRFEETVSFYENLIAQKARLRFDYPEYDLMLVRHPDGMIAEYVEHHDKNPADEIF